MKSRAFIDYFVKYDFTNIFRIWISSRIRVVRIRDVIFDKTLFYDFAKLDSKHLLITNVKNTLKVIEISNNIFFEMIVEENENDLSIDHLKDESIESRFEESANQTDSIEKTSILHTDIKNIYLLIFEMVSDRDQKFNENTIDTMSFLQIDWKINEMMNSNQIENQDVQETSNLKSSIENESQSQSSIKSKKSKQRTTMSNDVVIMNIRFRKQTYSIALAIVQTLKSYHAAFSIDLKRSKQKKSNISKLHKDDLLVESRYWKQMLRHRFSQKFQMIAQKKFFELKKKALFRESKKRINHEFFWSECLNTNSTSTTIWRNSRHDCVSEMIFNRLIRTRMRLRWLLKRFVLWWSFRLSLISKFDSTTRSVLLSIMRLMKSYTVNARTNFFDSITVENWIRLCTS